MNRLTSLAIIAMAALLSLAACNHPRPSAQWEPVWPTKITPAQQFVCRKGEPAYPSHGIDGDLLCTHSDGGKPCQNRSDCQGLCLAAFQPATAMSQIKSGNCASDDSRRGCFIEVDGGKATVQTCVD